MSNSLQPHGLQARILKWVAFPFSRGYPNPGIEPRSPALQVVSSLAEPQGKPKNTEVGRLFHLQQIFPTQESNQGLLHCRWILNQMSYQGSPDFGIDHLVTSCVELSLVLLEEGVCVQHAAPSSSPEGQIETRAWKLQGKQTTIGRCLRRGSGGNMLGISGVRW